MMFKKSLKFNDFIIEDKVEAKTYVGPLFIQHFSSSYVNLAERKMPAQQRSSKTPFPMESYRQRDRGHTLAAFLRNAPAISLFSLS